MTNLHVGQVYMCKVLEIRENYDHFPKPNPQKYCHRFILEYDDQQIDTQICTESTTQNYCREGDIVNIRVSKFSRMQYTLESIEVYRAHSTYGGVPKIPSFTPLPKVMEANGNEPEMAMYLAVEYNSKKEKVPFVSCDNSLDAVIADAEIILDWILSKKKTKQQ